MEQKHAACPPFDEDKFHRNFVRMDSNLDDKIDFEELLTFMRDKAVADG